MTLAPEPRTSPIVPSYGGSSLADLSASLLASLTGDVGANVLGLPETGRACLLIVDGLGFEQLRGHQAAAPFLAELAFNSRPLTAGFPTTGAAFAPTTTAVGTLPATAVADAPPKVDVLPWTLVAVLVLWLPVAVFPPVAATPIPASTTALVWVRTTAPLPGVVAVA